MEKIDLLSLLPSELEEFVISIGEPKYRAKQLFVAMHKGLSPAEITNIGNAMKKKLEEFLITNAPEQKKKKSGFS